jgi:hypothetical protein
MKQTHRSLYILIAATILGGCRPMPQKRNDCEALATTMQWVWGQPRTAMTSAGDFDKFLTRLETTQKNLHDRDVKDIARRYSDAVTDLTDAIDQMQTPSNEPARAALIQSEVRDASGSLSPIDSDFIRECSYAAKIRR